MQVEYISLEMIDYP